MDKKQAQSLIKETFESPFDKNSFAGFVKNLLNKVEEAPFIYRGNLIPDAYEQYIHSLERVGKYSDGEHKIDILIAKLKKEKSIERARTMQRNFVAWYLNGSRGGELKDAALVAFVAPNEKDWRFSLVKMDYRYDENRNKVVEEFTPARRWSFLVGVNENSHTAQSQLVDLVADDERNPVLNQIEEAFNIEKVTKEFFEKYRELFLWTKETLDGVVKKDKKIKADFEIKGVETVDFSKKLLGQIVFLYFLQKKGWFGVKRDADWGTGPKGFLRELFESKHGVYKNFFNDILEPLFYEALARERDDDFYSRFNCKIPFLNGGLFDPINNYDWVHTDIFLPNDLFSNDYKTKEGDKGNGILDIFDRYNFTVKEDEPLEKEVAVDPEMLGKVFENLLEVKDRKSKGTYYTPREIVHYMCQQSLINYLFTECSLPSPLRGEGKGEGVIRDEVKNPIPAKEDIELLIKYGETVAEYEAVYVEKMSENSEYKGKYAKPKLPKSIENNARLIDEKLAKIKVCDPAIGSGAFPVGMMGEIVKTRNVLSAYLSLREAEATKQSRSIYNFKRECIEKSLYGVDIDSGAVEIAKLRLWLSLVVDEDDIKQIKPLPNLDYKIVCGNSLLGVEKDLFNENYFNELESLKSLLFNETSPEKKKEYKKQIDQIIAQITNGHKDFDFEVYFSEVFLSGAKSASGGHEKKGFDVVIANPPYLEARSPEFSEQMKEEAQRGVRNRWGADSEYITRGADLLIYFLDLGIYLMAKKGTAVFITHNSWLDTDYGKKFQSFLLNHTNVKAIVDSDFKYFDSKLGPNINTVIPIFVGKEVDAKNTIVFARYHENFEKVNHSALNDEIKLSSPEIEVKRFKYNDSILRTLKWGTLLSSSDEALYIFSLIEKKGKHLNQLLNYDLSIGQGLNVAKSLVVEKEILEKFPFLNKTLIPFMRTEDRSPFVLQETNGFIIDGSQLTREEIKRLKSAGIDIFKPESTSKFKPILIMPRGVSRHYCAANSISAYSSSGVDIYDNKENLPEEMKLNLWLFLNSSIAWLIREITGRKSLGGGLLKAEATDLREMPIYFEFSNANEIKKIYEKLKKRKALPTTEEINTPEHKKIDEIVFDYLEMHPRQRLSVVELLKNHILDRITKSKT